MKGLKKLNVIGLAKNRKNKKNDLEVLLNQISMGNAVLFTGAGFSTEMRNKSNSEPPRASALANKIGTIGSFDSEGDLKFASDYFLKYGETEDLIQLLRNEYRIKDVTTSHETIIKQPWRRIYTTNYDDGIKFIATKNNLKFECINIEDSPSIYFKKKNTCVHINGSIDLLTNETIPDTFKLSNSSYISSETFEKSKWYFSFKKDLEQASAIVFIGYSLYDIEIKKVLFESEFFKKKTYFITREDSSPKSEFELSQFGTVYKTGINLFAQQLFEFTPEVTHQEFWLECFNEFKFKDCDTQISDPKILNFLLHGMLEEEYFDINNRAMNKLPYLVDRNTYISKCEDLQKEKQHVLLLSDFGNGKTVLLKNLASHLSHKGKKVFFLNNIEGNYIEDIDKIVARNKEAYLLVDDYENVKDLIKYVLTLNNQKLKMIITTRTAYQTHLINEIDFFDSIYELNIDILNDDESNYLIKVFDNLALWENQAGLSQDKKIRIIQEHNKSQFSHSLLNIFNAPQIKSRIEMLLSNLFINQEYKDTVLAICLLEILNLPLTYSNISEVALNSAIYSNSLHKNERFQQLFPSKNNEVLSKSSLYARNLLNNHFSGNYMVEKMLDIADKLQAYRNESTIENSIYKNLLRFSFIERVLPAENKLNMTTRYYEQLKARIYKLEKTPHFWLQYAMARLSNDDIVNAQKFLTTAYALAYNGYNTAYLDVQQARIYLYQSRREQHQNKSISHFVNAHKVLTNLENGQHKFRQVETYLDYFNEKYEKLSNKNKQIFEEAVTDMYNTIEKLIKGYFTENNRIDICYAKLRDIHEKIQS